MSIGKYTKRRITISAIQWTGNNMSDVLNFTGEAGIITNNSLQIFTPEGVMFPAIGDYIIRGIKGEIYSCKEEIFKESYDNIDS